jgi:hypothetical protein
MIQLILQLLQVDKFYGMSRNIDIAKGSNQIPMTIKEGLKQTKRKRAWR